jgi:hypothetical protein
MKGVASSRGEKRCVQTPKALIRLVPVLLLSGFGFSFLFCIALYTSTEFSAYFRIVRSKDKTPERRARRCYS